MDMKGANFDALADDMDAGLRELTAPVERDPSLWTRGVAGKWSAGQILDHVAKALEVTAHALERRELELREGTLPRRPGRGPLQALFVGMVVGAGKLPSGGKAPKVILPSEHPEQGDVLQRIARGAARHRSLGERMDPDDRDRLWIPNPFLPRWHYTLPEVVRMQAVHARHHAKQVTAIVARLGSSGARS